MRARGWLALLLALPLSAGAQMFWSENFNNGCSAGCSAAGYSSVNGTWTQTVVGTEGSDANPWYVSCAEEGRTPGNCGTSCSPTGASFTGPTLHVGQSPNALGDSGAVYDAGGLCGILTCPQTDRRIESPTINCSGHSEITIDFNYIEQGSPPNDDSEIWYFDGTTWAFLADTPSTSNGPCAGGGQWTAYSVALPASANNNPNVRIGFRWMNNDDGVGTDPSFAIDNISLSTPFRDGFEGP